MENTLVTFEERKQEYNKVPVAYCTECLSLRIRYTSDEDDYCDNCGGTDIKYATIDKWNDLFELKYGEEFLNNK